MKKKMDNGLPENKNSARRFTQGKNFLIFTSSVFLFSLFTLTFNSSVYAQLVTTGGSVNPDKTESPVRPQGTGLTTAPKGNTGTTSRAATPAITPGNITPLIAAGRAPTPTAPSTLSLSQLNPSLSSGISQRLSAPSLPQALGATSARLASSISPTFTMPPLSTAIRASAPAISSAPSTIPRATLPSSITQNTFAATMPAASPIHVTQPASLLEPTVMPQIAKQPASLPAPNKIGNTAIEMPATMPAPLTMRIAQPAQLPKATAIAVTPIPKQPSFSSPFNSNMPSIAIKPMEMPNYAPIRPTPLVNSNFNQPFNLTKINTISPIRTSITPLTNLQLPRLKPIDQLMIKPIGFSSLNMPKPIKMPAFNKTAMAPMPSIDKLVAKPIGLNPITMPKPINSAFTPIKMPGFNKAAVAPIPSIDKLMIKPIGLNPINSTFAPIRMPAMVIPSLKPIQAFPYKPLALSPISMPEPLANSITSIKAPVLIKASVSRINAVDPIRDIAQKDFASLSYLNKSLEVSQPDINLNKTIVKPISIQWTDMTNNNLNINLTKIPAISTKYPLNPLSLETQKTIKIYDTKTIRDAGKINAMVSAINVPRPLSTAGFKVDLDKFVQSGFEQRKQIIDNAKVYTDASQIQKLQALHTWRNEYDKFMALSANISQITEATGQVDASSLESLQNVKENLDTLTREVSNINTEKNTLQQFINASQGLNKPQIQSPLNLPRQAPATNFLRNISQNLGNLVSMPAHAED
ncbi:MAG: hypothetical protein WC546_05010 [Candidatus Omnitrophota bacterium]